MQPAIYGFYRDPRTCRIIGFAFEHPADETYSVLVDLDYNNLQERMGTVALARRMATQANDHANHFFGHKKLHRRSLYGLYLLACRILRLPPVFIPGQRNALDVKVTQTEFVFKNLPAAFDGFRILHISDLHMDGIPRLLDVLIRMIEPLEYDLCVLTGDFREGILGAYDEPSELAVRLREAVTTDVLGVLGNHDAIEMVSALERGGICMLLNEHKVIQRDGEQIVILGVDDPHYYQADDLERALAGSPPGVFKILLAHSPEIIEKAFAAGVDFYLCGHTHAGQVCLPGGKPLLTSSRGPDHCKNGRWEHSGVTGYTSPGAGASSVPIRFNCPPEITIHTLRTR
jgi:predicted MPP superfamily phosphohydrolase